MKSRIEHIEYLNACKKNQLALLVTRHVFQCPKDTRFEGEEFACIRERMVVLKADYLTLENRRRVQAGEGPLKSAGPLPWGEWEIPNLVISHNGQRYLRFYPYHGDLEYCETRFEMNGREIAEGSCLYQELSAIVGARRKKPSVCKAVNLACVTALSLCNRDGYPETDVIFERLEDFVKLNTK